MLFEFLVASAHTASADIITKKYGNSALVAVSSQHCASGTRKSAKLNNRAVGPSIVTEDQLPIYLKESSMQLDTLVGHVDAKILTRRSPEQSHTMAFQFQYHGNSALRLSPFAVDFTSHELINHRLKLDLFTLPKVIQSFQPYRKLYNVGNLIQFVSQYIHKWGNEEITVYMTSGFNLPRMPVRVYEFAAKTPELLAQIQYTTDPATPRRTCMQRQSPPLGIMYMNNRDESMYDRYIDTIVTENLEAFGKMCWMEQEHQFPEWLFELMITVQVRGELEVCSSSHWNLSTISLTPSRLISSTKHTDFSS